MTSHSRKGQYLVNKTKDSGRKNSPNQKIQNPKKNNRSHTKGERGTTGGVGKKRGIPGGRREGEGGHWH